MTGDSDSPDIWPSAAILLTGLSASGKTTQARRLVSRLEEFGLTNVVLIDGEDFRARLHGRHGHNPADREAVWRKLVGEASREMKSGKVVVIAAIAHRTAMRAMARKRLRPFFEVFLDCPVAVCAARDVKGHYRRAFAAEYDCFIGVTHPYEQSEPELRLDTAALSATEAEDQLAERVLQFLATADTHVGFPPGYWLARIATRILADKAPPSLWESSWLRNSMLQKAQSRRPVVRMERPACAQLFVVFGGMDVNNGSTGGEFTGRQLEWWRRCGLLRRNLMYIRDPYLENFSRGISDEVPDAESLAEWIATYVRSLAHVREVHGIGYSSGSYGALTFGHLCRMKSVWAFSPRTVRLSSSEEAMARLTDLLSEYNGVTQYNIWYSAFNKRDKEFAERLVDCPGVTVHPYSESGDDHILIGQLAFTGVLPAILPPYVASAGRPPGGSTND